MDNPLDEEDPSTIFDELEVRKHTFVNLVLSSKFPLLCYVSRTTTHADYARANKHVPVIVIVLVLETEAL